MSEKQGGRPDFRPSQEKNEIQRKQTVAEDLSCLTDIVGQFEVAKTDTKSDGGYAGVIIKNPRTYTDRNEMKLLAGLNLMVSKIRFGTDAWKLQAALVPKGQSMIEAKAVAESLLTDDGELSYLEDSNETRFDWHDVLTATSAHLENVLQKSRTGTQRSASPRGGEHEYADPLDSVEPKESAQVETLLKKTEGLVFTISRLVNKDKELPGGVTVYQDDGHAAIIMSLSEFINSDSTYISLEQDPNQTFAVGIYTHSKSKTKTLMLAIDDQEASSFTMLLDNDNVVVASIIEGNKAIDMACYDEIVDDAWQYVRAYAKRHSQEHKNKHQR